MSFLQTLAHDADLRDAFVDYLTSRIADENSLDRIDGAHSLDFQKGRVAELKKLVVDARKQDEHKGDT